VTVLITRAYARRLVREGKAVETALLSPDGTADIVTVSRRDARGRVDHYYPHGVDIRRILAGASRTHPASHPQMRSIPAAGIGRKGSGKSGLINRAENRDAEGGAAIQELGHAVMWCRMTS
jgi:hypothetical protein